MITAELLLALNPRLERASAEVTAMKLEWACTRYMINTPGRRAHFLAQIAHESGFRPVEENLMYRAETCCRVWPSRFPTHASAAPYALNPERLANRVYANRMGNGDEASGDGFRYRGRGFIQITGRDNYVRYGRKTGFPLEGSPELALQIGISSLVSACYFNDHGLNQLADRGGLSRVREITRRINGGYVGLADREAYYRKAAWLLRRA